MSDFTPNVAGGLFYIKDKLRLRTRFRHFLQYSQHLGYFGAFTFYFRKAFLARQLGGPIHIRTSALAQFPLAMRTGSTDSSVFHQIFVDGDYDCVASEANVNLVLDCGANAGYSAAYFLSRYPSCEVIAVEPDPANYRILQFNAAPYRNRVSTMRAAIWSHPTQLALNSAYRDGGEWSRQVQPPTQQTTGNVPAVDIGTIFRNSRHSRISIVKMDIEGAEAVVFSGSHTEWIDFVDCIVIELHDDTHFGDATSMFLKAIANRGFLTTHHGERTVCKRPPAARPEAK